MCMQVCVCTCMCVSEDACVHASVCVCVCEDACVHCKCVCVCVCAGRGVFSPSGWRNKNQHHASIIADVRAIYRLGHGHVRDLKEAKHLGTFQSSGRARVPAHPRRKPHLYKSGSLPSLNTTPTGTSLCRYAKTKSPTSHCAFSP